jgi:hypothetical protein
MPRRFMIAMCRSDHLGKTKNSRSQRPSRYWCCKVTINVTIFEYVLTIFEYVLTCQRVDLDNESVHVCERERECVCVI